MNKNFLLFISMVAIATTSNIPLYGAMKKEINECLLCGGIPGEDNIPLPKKSRKKDAALVDAVFSGDDLSLIKQLLADGADVNATNSNATNSGGRFSVLMIAAANGCKFASYKERLEIVTLLLNAGAKIDVLNNRGVTALMCASCYGYTEIVKMLLDLKVDPNRRDELKNTALHYAAEEGYSKIVEMLLQAGAYVNPKNIDGKTPLDLARKKSCRNNETIQLLESMLPKE